MTTEKLGLSLKYKLLFLLTVIPVASLSIYLFIATKEFEKDKLPYVLDSTAAMAKSLSQQTRIEVDGFIDKTALIMRSFDRIEGRFIFSAENNEFQKADRIDALLVYQKQLNQNYILIGQIAREQQLAQAYVKDPQRWINFVSVSSQQGVAIQSFERSEMHLHIGFRVGPVESADHLVIIGLYRSSDLYKAFTASPLYKSYLIDRQGVPTLGAASVFTKDFFKPILQSPLPDGTQELDNERPQIVGFSSVGIGQMSVVSVVDKKEALKAVQNLIIKSLLFFVGLIALTVIISLLASIQLTSKLRELYEATKQVAQGHFKVQVEKNSNDEVGGLTEGFNYMAKEMERLIDETKNKARMEGELETVKIVQETLFPAQSKKIGDFEIVGHFEPASECGGDWWNYSMVNDKLFLWIGDATGHGAPAAMVTSAACAVAKIIESMPLAGPGFAMGILNKAIAETTKGRILMTFFIASIDLKTGEMTYASASHEPPYVIRKSDKKISKKNLEPLIDASGPRLGDNKEASYIEAKAHLHPGDAILLYTDGIIDVKNAEGQPWGERGFIKSICDSSNEAQSANDRVIHLKTRIQNYRQKTELPDDVTFVMCQYDKGAA